MRLCVLFGFSVDLPNNNNKKKSTLKEHTMSSSTKENKPCQEERQMFIDCIFQHSNCADRMRNEGIGFSDCITKASLPYECEYVRKRLYTCRRSLVRVLAFHMCNTTTTTTLYTHTHNIRLIGERDSGPTFLQNEMEMGLCTYTYTTKGYNCSIFNAIQFSSFALKKKEHNFFSFLLVVVMSAAAAASFRA